MIVYSIFTVKINSVKASGMRKGEGILLPLVTNRKTPDREIWGSFKVHVHFTCIFLSFLGLPAVWSVSVSGCFYCRCPVAVLSKVVGLASLCFELYLVDIKYFNLNLFRIGFQKGTLKYNHSTLNGSSTPSEFKITCQCSHVCYELGADTGFTVSAKLNWQISIRHQTR